MFNCPVMLMWNISSFIHEEICSVPNVFLGYAIRVAATYTEHSKSATDVVCALKRQCRNGYNLIGARELQPGNRWRRRSTRTIKILLQSIFSSNVFILCVAFSRLTLISRSKIAWTLIFGCSQIDDFFYQKYCKNECKWNKFKYYL